jgi:hypothetical protein
LVFPGGSPSTGGGTSRFGPAPSPLISASGGGAGILPAPSPPTPENSGTLTGGTYDLTLPWPANPGTDERRLGAFRGIGVTYDASTAKYFGERGELGNGAPGNGGEGVIAIYELIS